MGNLSYVNFYIPGEGTSIIPGWGIYRFWDKTYFDFATDGPTPQTFTATPQTIASPLDVVAAVSGLSVSKWVPRTTLSISGALLSQFGGTSGAAFMYELFDMNQSPPTLSPLSGTIQVWIAAGTDQVPPNSGTVSLPPAILATGYGTVKRDPVTGVLTWCDPGTNTPRVTGTPMVDGSGGFTLEEV